MRETKSTVKEGSDFRNHSVKPLDHVASDRSSTKEESMTVQL